MKSFDEIYEIVKQTLSEQRFYHSVCVMERAAEYAKIYGIDIEKAKLAGILHDIAKEIPKDKRISECDKYGVKLDDIEKNNKGLIHGKLGAKIAEIYGMDKEICLAIEYHTTGRENMNLLEKILYLADFSSKDREFDDTNYIYEMTKKDIDKALVYCFTKTIREKIDNEKQIHINTINAYNFYLK